MFQLFCEQGIRFCLVHIPEMLETLLPQIVGPGYQTRPGCKFRLNQFTQPVLSRAELDRLNRLFALKKQVERLAGRWAVKNLVMQETGLSPDAIEIHNDPSGAPALASAFKYAISISHSGDYALAALCENVDAVGVDLETITPVDISAFCTQASPQKSKAHTPGQTLQPSSKSGPSKKPCSSTGALV